jgi:hypothetical protein
MSSVFAPSSNEAIKRVIPSSVILGAITSDDCAKNGLVFEDIPYQKIK